MCPSDLAFLKDLKKLQNSDELKKIEDSEDSQILKKGLVDFLKNCFLDAAIRLEL